MSFSINGPDNIPAIQKSHHANDGGAGNLGYFQQRKKQEEEEEEKQDVVEISSKKKEENPEKEKIEKTIQYFKDQIKNFWIKFKIKKRGSEKIL